TAILEPDANVALLAAADHVGVFGAAPGVGCVALERGVAADPAHHARKLIGTLECGVEGSDPARAHTDDRPAIGVAAKLDRLADFPQYFFEHESRVSRIDGVVFDRPLVLRTGPGLDEDIHHERNALLDGEIVKRFEHAIRSRARAGVVLAIAPDLHGER